MKIKTYEKVAVDTLHVAGVEAELVAKFKAITEKTGARGSFYMNQMLGDFIRSAEKTAKPKATRKAATA